MPVGEVIVQPWKKKEVVRESMITEKITDPPEADRVITAPLAVEKKQPDPGQDFTDTARLKVCLDIEINLVVNGQKVHVK